MAFESVFKVDPRPDGGEFAGGKGASLAWDVLHRTGKHKLPDSIDLSGCRHLKPYSLACLCALGELGQHNGRPVRIVKPDDPECADHLARLGVPGFFVGGWNALPSRSSNLPIRRVAWPPHSTAEEIVEFLAPRTDQAPGVFPKMVESLDEVISNALTHAASPIDCLVAGQAYPNTGKVEIAVLDLGQTVRGHLTQNPEFASISRDDQAILKAMEDGVTGTPRGSKNRRGEDNSGAGLADLRAYCQAGGGEMTILSGTHWLTCQPGAEPVTGELFGRFRGCLVNIRYFTEKQLSSEAVEAIL